MCNTIVKQAFHQMALPNSYEYWEHVRGARLSYVFVSVGTLDLEYVQLIVSVCGYISPL